MVLTTVLSERAACQTRLDELAADKQLLRIQMTDVRNENRDLLDERVKWWAEEDRLKANIATLTSQLAAMRKAKTALAETQEQLAAAEAENTRLTSERMALLQQVRGCLCLLQNRHAGSSRPLFPVEHSKAPTVRNSTQTAYFPKRMFASTLAQSPGERQHRDWASIAAFVAP